jgi:hypothetical protein
MPRKFALEYIDRLLADATYMDLVHLSSVLCSSARYQSTAPDYGLSPPAFLFIETLSWFAQSTRSGVSTYYEATPPARQNTMLAALEESAPEEFRTWYERGMRDWREEGKITAVDDWIEANDQRANEWLLALARKNRDALVALTQE